MLCSSIISKTLWSCTYKLMIKVIIGDCNTNSRCNQVTRTTISNTYFPNSSTSTHRGNTNSTISRLNANSRKYTIFVNDATFRKVAISCRSCKINRIASTNYCIIGICQTRTTFTIMKILENIINQNHSIIGFNTSYCSTIPSNHKFGGLSIKFFGNIIKNSTIWRNSSSIKSIVDSIEWSSIKWWSSSIWTYSCWSIWWGWEMDISIFYSIISCKIG